MDVLEKAVSGARLEPREVEALYQLPLSEVAAAAHEVRLRKSNPEVVTYLIDRNINYTNICTVACSFCAFYRTRRQQDAYTLSYEEISQKIEELKAVGGRRILMQGGVNPELPFEWYLEMLRYLKREHPDVRIDAFSPEEILGLEKLTGRPALELLAELKEAGLDGMPGAGAEILVDEVRTKVAPARIRTQDWFRIIDAAQSLGLYTLATMVIGLGETPAQRAEHLLKLRAQQDKALEQYGQGFAAFAVWTLQTEHTRLKGKAPGATAHEYLQQLAIARLTLDNIPNLQASWPTLGFKVAQAALYYGANDFGSTMLEENVVSAAGGHTRTHATERQIIRHIVDAGFKPAERDVYYNIIRWPEVEPEPTELPMA
ncbi:cyclic dehypoxanthinyl futalosine synthase [Marinithermus hydrothermalis]|uniref:Cyclic dehypoxanthine futalosine synthase n=1 Tax=Marinithermus hydrothermalis (strain DSM 14884 / JCM 11576 / T1) TaxID=869210 RepID=F2NPB3_MARHT|nr:cyclic dehypoxanthinyl futalosine synthase [Marinithermus hydrothermalis]AEB11914.1 menaquinone biosynthesis protein [Marinithermus hydrothermalis DSM 14884]